MNTSCKVLAVFLLLAVAVRAINNEGQGTMDAAVVSEEEAEFAALAESELDMAARLASRVHHKWGLWGGPNDKVHEDIVNTGFGLLSATEKTVYNIDKLINGVRSPDMPCAGPACEGTYLDGVQFAINFKSPNNRRELVYNSHYGCLQHWHAQGSVVVGPTLATPNGAERYVFTNTELKGFMLAQAQQWWGLASTANKDLRSYYLGKVLHMLQDSYPRGHTLRDNSDNYPYMTSTDPYDPTGKGKTMAKKCGYLYYFQGYDGQHGNGAHAGADKMPTPAHQDWNRLQCARYYTWKLMSLLARCGAAGSGPTCSWDHAKKVLDEAWQLNSWAAGRKTAGSAEAYAGPGLASKGFTKVAYPAGLGNVWEPTSAKLWSSIPSSSGGVSLCPPTLIGKAPSVPYAEHPFTQFVNQKKGSPIPSPILVDCFTENGNVFYGSTTGDCKCSNMIMTCGRASECKPMPGKGCNGGVCKCWSTLPGNTCRCVVPHSGFYPFLCKSEKYGTTKP